MSYHVAQNERALVSILTPVCNGEKYIAECIESVLSQTYGTWEYIVVNNCSTDGTLKIAESYANKDNRIRIHNNEKPVGMIENHNIAFRLLSPRSKYCKVVHADDWLFPNCLHEMVALAEAHPSVGIVGAYRLEGERVTLDGLPYARSVIPGSEICRLTLLGGPYLFGSPSSLLIRSDMIRNREAFYNTSNIHADTEGCYDVLQNSDFGFVHQVLTFTRRHDEASTSFARRMNSYIPGNLVNLMKYGPIYLTREEYERRFEKQMEDYYTFLCRSLLHRREKEFWSYHKDALERLGHPYRLSKLMKPLLVLMVDRVLNPKRTIQGQIRRIVGTTKG